VNEFGNAYLDEKGEFVKVSDQGVTDEMWAEMASYAKSKNLKAGDYKKLNLPFENKLLGLPREIRARMAKGVEDFVYELLTKVFNAQDTAPLAIEAILKAGSYDVGPKGERIENPADWTEQKIKERASKIHGDKGAKGNFDD
jgi:fructose-bisphosphate aldolase, class II